MNDCPNIEILKRYVRRSMRQHEWNRVNQHVNQCDPCSTAISDIESDIEKGLGVTETLPPTPLIKPRTSDLPTHDDHVGSRDSDDQYIIKMLHIPDYKLLRKIGKGGFGEVWIAQPLAGPHCAVKVFPKSTLKATEFEGLKTYRNLVSGHPNLVQVLHVGETESHYYYVMELADGYNTTPIFSFENYEPRSLSKDLHRNGPCGFDQAVDCTRHILAGLKRLHQEELLHRDIKPANVIFVGGVLKLADIGLIKKEDSLVPNAMTRAYAPPEGIQDRSGDLYCLGKTLFEMITGAPPQTYPDWLAAKNPQQKAAFNKLKPIIDKACSEKPEDRYQMVDDFSADLEKLTAPTKPGWLKRNKLWVMTIVTLILFSSGFIVVRNIVIRNKVEGLLVTAKHDMDVKQWYYAAQKYTQVLVLDSDNHVAPGNTAICYIRLYNKQSPNGDPKLLDDAKTLCDQAIRVTPYENQEDLLHIVNALGVARRKNEEYDLAIEAYRNGIRIVENNASLSYSSYMYSTILENLGIALMFTDQLDEAERYIQKSAHLTGTKEQCEYPWRNLAAIKLFKGDRSCKTYLDKAERCKRDDALRWLLEARMYLEIEPFIDYQKARDKVIAAIESTKLQYIQRRANRLLAIIDLSNGEYQEAYGHAHEAIALGDNKIVNHLLLSIAQYHLGLKDAKTNYDQAIKYLSESPLTTYDYIVEFESPGGTLWIDSYDQIMQLKSQAENLIFTSKTAP